MMLIGYKLFLDEFSKTSSRGITISFVEKCCQEGEYGERDNENRGTCSFFHKKGKKEDALSVSENPRKSI